MFAVGTSDAPVHEYEGAFQGVRDFYDLLDEEQKDRYDAFRHSTFSKDTIRKLLQYIQAGGGVVGGAFSTDSTQLVVRTLAKLFTEDLVTTARSLAEAADYHGPLQPHHIRRAYRIISQQGKALGTQRGGQGGGMLMGAPY